MTMHEATRADASNPALAQAVNQKTQELLSRAAADPAFRARLREDPRAVIAEFSGRPAGAELSDQELETVAGGGIGALVDAVVDALADALRAAGALK